VRTLNGLERYRYMANPFDLRAILLAKHAQHVVLIHFPIALFMTGVGLDLASRGKRESQLTAAAYYRGGDRHPDIVDGTVGLALRSRRSKNQGPVADASRSSHDCCAVSDHVMVGALEEPKNASAPAGISNSNRTTRSRSHWIYSAPWWVLERN